MYAFQPEPAPWEGIFWVDRWGQGRLAPHEFVDEKLFPRLQKYAGTRIGLFGARNDGELEPGATVLTGFDSIKAFAQQPVGISLRWFNNASNPGDSPVRRMRSGQDVLFEVQVTNMDQDELILDTNELMIWFTVRHPPAVMFNAFHQSYGGISPHKRPRGVLRYSPGGMNLFPQDTRYTANPVHAFSPQPRGENPVSVKAGGTFAWKVTISGWLPNEYELFVKYHKYDKDATPFNTVMSNLLSLDVLTDEPRLNDLIELHVRLRDKTELKPGQPVPLEIVFQNRSEAELRIPFLKGTKDDLDLSDMLFCYGNDGRILPLTTKVAGPMEIRVPVNGSFTLPVDAPAGTEVARAVFHNASFTPKWKGEGDPNGYVHGWHWSEHWQHPSVREQVP